MTFRRFRPPRRFLRAGTVLLLAGCAGPQHVLAPGGPDAERIERLWWVLFAPAAVVSAVVTVLLLYAMRRALDRSEGSPRLSSRGARLLVWGGGVVVPLVVLFPILVYNFHVGNEVFPGGDDVGQLTVEVIGHQFWWEVRYPAYGISTANEIRIPVGIPVDLRLSSPDVIHSFWVPRLHGKTDMVPGRVSRHRLEASEPGRYRGQCAEYCGLSHALMGLWVVALPPVEFEDWVDDRTQPAIEPEDPEVVAGRQVFFAAGCAACHATRDAPLPSVLGTPGPDLSDLATRGTLAAATLPNTRANLAAWITDPGRIKPGSRMPGTRLPDAQMQALVTYLESLR